MHVHDVTILVELEYHQRKAFKVDWTHLNVNLELNHVQTRTVTNTKTLLNQDYGLISKAQQSPGSQVEHGTFA